MGYDQTGNEEEFLRKHCAELEQRLRQDALSFENEALEVQLHQIQDDHAQLHEEFRGTREFYTKRVADMTSQLEDRARTTCTAEGHADCLSDLLVFHEDNGVLAGSYWRAQCEKRDDSIRFLSLKLQEYTVPSAEYHSRQGLQNLPPTHSPPDPSSPSTLSRSEASPAAGASKGHPGAMKAAERAFQALSERHSRLCEEVREAEARAAGLEWDLQERERRCRGRARAADDPSPPKLDVDEIRQEAEEVSTPTWATRCAWRDELDQRAGQLERTSLQFDATKRSLDAANEELQWQATSAEALRTRLTDVLRATSAEERRSQEAFAEEARRSTALQELLQRWTAMKPDAPLPAACIQAQQLLRPSEGQEEAPRA